MADIKVFQRQETIVLRIDVYDANGDLADADTTPTVTVTGPAGTAVVSAQNMTNLSTGVYTYAYTPGASADLGWYVARFTVTDDSRVTKVDDGFYLEP